MSAEQSDRDRTFAADLGPSLFPAFQIARSFVGIDERPGQDLHKQPCSQSTPEVSAKAPKAVRNVSVKVTSGKVCLDFLKQQQVDGAKSAAYRVLMTREPAVGVRSEAPNVLRKPKLPNRPGRKDCLLDNESLVSNQKSLI